MVEQRRSRGRGLGRKVIVAIAHRRRAPRVLQRRGPDRVEWALRASDHRSSPSSLGLRRAVPRRRSLAYGSMVPSRTATGSALALRTESFRRFLASSEGKHVEWAWKHGVLREYSAWAVALGAADAWSQAISSSNIPDPSVAMSGPMLMHTHGLDVHQHPHRSVHIERFERRIQRRRRSAAVAAEAGAPARGDRSHIGFPADRDGVGHRRVLRRFPDFVGRSIGVALVLGLRWWRSPRSPAVPVIGSVAGVGDVQAASPGSALTRRHPLPPAGHPPGGARDNSTAGSTTRVQVSGACGVPAGGQRGVGHGHRDRRDERRVRHVVRGGVGEAERIEPQLSARFRRRQLGRRRAVGRRCDRRVRVVVRARPRRRRGRVRRRRPARCRPAGSSRWRRRGIVDTRTVGGAAPGDLAVPLPAGVAPDATAVAISVTVTDPTAPVYVTVHPNGSPRPTSSIVNSEPLERARAVTVLAPVTPAGLVRVPIGAGERHRRRDRLVHRARVRLRRPTGCSSSSRRRVCGTRARPPIRSTPVARSSANSSTQPAAAVLANVTAIDSTAPGYVSAYPAGTPQPYVSMLNVTWREPAGEHDDRVELDTRGLRSSPPSARTCWSTWPATSPGTVGSRRSAAEHGRPPIRCRRPADRCCSCPIRRSPSFAGTVSSVRCRARPSGPTSSRADG